jgi:hypothetical protein
VLFILFPSVLDNKTVNSSKYYWAVLIVCRSCPDQALFNKARLHCIVDVLQLLSACDVKLCGYKNQQGCKVSKARKIISVAVCSFVVFYTYDLWNCYFSALKYFKGEILICTYICIYDYIPQE